MDSVLESTKAKEAEVKKQTSEQLDAFRRQQEEAEKAANQQETSNAPETADAWTIGPRKRKKGRETTVGGIKLRRTSTAEKQPDLTNASASDPPKQPPGDVATEAQKTNQTVKTGIEKANTASAPTAPATVTAASKSSSSPATGLGLAAYSSDEDE